MVYAPNDPSTIIAGLNGDSSAFAALLANVDDAYVNHGPTLVCCSVSFEVSATSATPVGEFVIPANDDNNRVRFWAYWRGTTGYTATLTFEVVDGAGTVLGSGTATSTSSSYAFSVINVTPTGSGVRYGRISLHASAVQLARIEHIVASVYPSSTPAGLTTSGWAQVSGWDLSPTGPIPSEVVARLSNNTRAVARIRPCGLVSGLHRYGGGVPNYEVTGNVYTLVDRFYWPGGDLDRRKYRASIRLGGTDPQARLVVGPYSFECSAAGWQHDLPTLYLPQGSPGFVYCRSTSGGTAQLRTYQMLREAA